MITETEMLKKRVAKLECILLNLLRLVNEEHGWTNPEWDSFYRELNEMDEIYRREVIKDETSPFI